MDLIGKEKWDDLEELALDDLDTTNAKSNKGYFYLGIALYKMRYYSQALKAF